MLQANKTGMWSVEVHLLVSQSSPSKPATQVQVYPFTASLHAACLGHGLLTHSSMSKITQVNATSMQAKEVCDLLRWTCLSHSELPHNQQHMCKCTDVLHHCTHPHFDMGCLSIHFFLNKLPLSLDMHESHKDLLSAVHNEDCNKLIKKANAKVSPRSQSNNIVCTPTYIEVGHVTEDFLVAVAWQSDVSSRPVEVILSAAAVEAV